MNETVKDRIRGVVFGTAIGDALGWPVEFNTHVTADTPGVFPKSIPRQYTDDTQMFRAVCEGLLRVHDDLDQAAENIAADFIGWANSPENNRAPGASCMAGCKNLEEGKRWREAGVNSGGCGTAMRSMAYGIFFRTDPAKAAKWAAEHALMTHNNPMAQAAAAAVAAGVGSLLNRRKTDWVTDARAAALMSVMAKCWDRRTALMLTEAGNSPSHDPVCLLDKWRGWAGHEAVAASLWCFLKHPDDYEKAVLLAVNSPGDSDSLGAITGALVGARVGLSGIPERWVDTVEDKEGLEVLASRIITRLG
jgi:ADP-ribosylglycohydrolase